MEEIWDYHLGADVWIINSKNQILIQKRSPKKRQSPNVWAMTGGSVIKGETSLQTIERETQEELGIQLNMGNIQFIKHYKTRTVWLDTYFIRQDIDLKDVVMQEDEVFEVVILNIQTIYTWSTMVLFLIQSVEMMKN